MYVARRRRGRGVVIAVRVNPEHAQLEMVRRTVLGRGYFPNKGKDKEMGTKMVVLSNNMQHYNRTTHR